MSSYTEDINNKPFEFIDMKSACETNSDESTNISRHIETRQYMADEVISDLLSDSISEINGSHSDDESEEDPFNSKTPMAFRKNNLNENPIAMKRDSVRSMDQSTMDTVEENIEKLSSLAINFHKGRFFNACEVMNIVNQIKVDSERTRFVKLSFQNCKYVNDADLNNISNMLGTKLGNVEYLSLSFLRSSSTTIFGIQQLIKTISGQRNTIKSLRLTIRRHKHLGNQHLTELIRGIRTSLVSLEELHIVLSGNLWVTSRGIKTLKDDRKIIDGLGLGLKKYEVSHYWLNTVGPLKDEAAKDMSKYIMDKFKEMEVKEGMLISNKVFVWFKRAVNSKIVNNKIILDEENKVPMA